MQYDIHTMKDIRLFHTTIPSGRRNYREHCHTECEISVILSGAGTYLVDGRENQFSDGDVLLFGSNEAHCITDVCSDGFFDMLTVKFEPKLLWNSADNSVFLLSELFFGRRKEKSNCIPKEKSASAYTKEMMLEIESEFSRGELGHELKIRLNLYAILLSLLRERNAKPEAVHPVARAVIMRLGKAMDYIDENLSQPLTLDEIASHAAMSRAHFSTVFKKYNGISPWDYITIKRVEGAIERIRTTDKTKLEIAAECGFSSPANFYKAFRRVTGKAPKDYI